MKRGKDWADKLLSKELVAEPLPLEPVLELCGDKRVLIENHFGVTEYSLEHIGVKVRFGILNICGCDLRLRKMEGQVLVITGKIDNITLTRGRT